MTTLATGNLPSPATAVHLRYGELHRPVCLVSRGVLRPDGLGSASRSESCCLFRAASEPLSHPFRCGSDQLNLHPSRRRATMRPGNPTSSFCSTGPPGLNRPRRSLAARLNVRRDACSFELHVFARTTVATCPPSTAAAARSRIGRLFVICRAGPARPARRRGGPSCLLVLSSVEL